MTDYKPQRFNKVLRELNISLDRAVEFLANKGIDIDHRPTAKISQEVYTILSDEFQTDKSKKVASKEIGEEKRKEKEEIRLALEREAEKKRLEDEARKAEIFKTDSEKISGPKMVGKIDIDPKPEVKEEEPEEVVSEKKESEAQFINGSKKLKGLKQVGKIDVEPKAKKAEKKEPVVEVAPEKPVKEEVKPVVKEMVIEVIVSEDTDAEETETLKTEYQKLSGPKKTGETIDLSKFERPKKK
ncbi:MAG: translation initiation factor IF-2, partial [Lutimonas sp.]